MPDTTIYPFRQALSLSLRHLVLSKGIPAINAGLSAMMTAQGVPLPRIPALSESSVVLGDLSPVSSATLCILDGGERNERIASGGLFALTLITQFQIKTPAIGDNFPEDFTLLGQVVTDNLRDLLTSTPNIIPATPGGLRLLPAGMSFQDCYYLSANTINFPQREADKVTYTRGLVIKHTASIEYFQNRPSSLGA